MNARERHFLCVWCVCHVISHRTLLLWMPFTSSAQSNRPQICFIYCPIAGTFESPSQSRCTEHLAITHSPNPCLNWMNRKSHSLISIFNKGRLQCSPWRKSSLLFPLIIYSWAKRKRQYMPAVQRDDSDLVFAIDTRRAREKREAEGRTNEGEMEMNGRNESEHNLGDDYFFPESTVCFSSVCWIHSVPFLPFLLSCFFLYVCTSTMNVYIINKY